MFDLLLSLCVADLLVGLVTIPVNLLLETDLLHRPALCYSALFLSQGKLIILSDVLTDILTDIFATEMRYELTRCPSDHDMFGFVHWCSRQYMNNLVFLVPHVASIFSLVLISYEEWITNFFSI